MYIKSLSCKLLINNPPVQEYDAIYFYKALEAFVDGREVKPIDVVTATTVARVHWVQVIVTTPRFPCNQRSVPKSRGDAKKVNGHFFILKFKSINANYFINKASYQKSSFGVYS